MGRKNGASGSRSQRRPQARKAEPGEYRRKPRAAGQPPPPQLNKMVLPTGRCGRKLIFASEAQVAKALTQAQTSRRRQGSLGRVEDHYYYHSLCKGWHLTSQTQYR